MRAMPLLMAAMLPIAAVADQDTQAANWDYEQLRGSWRVSEIIGSEVQATDGTEYGEVKDVVLTSDGRISSVLVESDMALSGRDAAAGASEERVEYEVQDDEAAARAEEERVSARDRDEGMYDTRNTDREGDDQDRLEENKAETMLQDDRVGRVVTREEEGEPQDRHDPTTQDNTNYMARDDLSRLPAEAETVDEGEQVRRDERAVAGTAVREDGLVELEWRNPSFNADENVVRLDVSNQARTVALDEERQMAAGTGAQGEIRASDLIGMDVNLSDEESYGEVEDVLVSADGEATALVVDSWNFLTKDRYAIPVELNNVNIEENVIDYQLSSEEVEGFGEFEFDEYLETT